MRHCITDSSLILLHIAFDAFPVRTSLLVTCFMQYRLLKKLNHVEFLMLWSSSADGFCSIANGIDAT